MVSPEVIAEQVMGYVVGAMEMIPTLTPWDHPYTIAILPQGPHFYTWLLQAAGYLLLDSSKKKLLVISEQYDDLKHILIDGNNYGPVFGKMQKQSMKQLGTLTKEFQAKVALPDQMNLFENIRYQLPFIRVISDIQDIVHVGIGPQISQTAKKIFLKWVKKHIQEYAIVALTNIELPEGKQGKIKNEQQLVAEIISDTTNKSSNVIEFFKEISRYIKQEAEIIAYINPKDIGKKMSLTTRYVCAVA